ncbi:MAG: hypothetical protein HC886_20080 [Leptolyngbyaceae cyanobacterium SM1_1_3]|nr:hypothetical protein [Leptolyngbyaceae cyanobacterium SM1_1_3]NJN04606.1 hypothetical protein [Leptolyngbyaceae cyanobacterium RM1_1_2]NJO11542.1 hypothetical protein [Leptolyngbyaceae cyanobacterium SL_1_1]
MNSVTPQQFFAETAKPAPLPTSRQVWMTPLAQAPLALLERRVAVLGDCPDDSFLRSPILP